MQIIRQKKFQKKEKTKTKKNQQQKREVKIKNFAIGVATKANKVTTF